MGSFSELYFANTRTPPKQGELSEASPYLLAKYHVPLLWLALFEPKDLTGISNEDGEDSQAYLVKERPEALRVLESREAVISASFPNLKPLWLTQFKTLLDQTPFQYVHVDTSEVGRSDLERMMGIFSSVPSELAPSFLDKLLRRRRASRSWVVFNIVLGPAFKGNAGNKPWPYCGESGTDVAMAWESDP